VSDCLALGGMSRDSIVLPLAGQQVRVRAPGVSLVCSVVTSDAHRLVLSAQVDHVDGPAEVVFAHSLGVACLTGHLVPLASGSEFRIDGITPLEQRRTAFRVGIAGPVRLTRRDGSVQDAELKDLSVEGARVLSSAATPLADPVTVVLTLPDGELTVTGRVARVDDRGYGIRFDPLSRADETRLSRMLTAEQRHRVRVRD
jgi:hypothetical protein